MGKRQNRRTEEAREETPATGRFTLGSTVRFGAESWIVDKYHKVQQAWEIVFRPQAGGKSRSIACKQLEMYAE